MNVNYGGFARNKAGGQGVSRFSAKLFRNKHNRGGSEVVNNLFVIPGQRMQPDSCQILRKSIAPSDDSLLITPRSTLKSEERNGSQR